MNLKKIQYILIKVLIRKTQIIISGGIGTSSILMNTEDSERATVRRWLEYNQIPYNETQIRKEQENSEIDISFENFYFQITKIPDSQFYKNLRVNKNGNKDNVTGNNFAELIQQAINNKKDKYKEKVNIILLIDGHPLGFPLALLQEKNRIELKQNSIDSGFKAVWFVGVGPGYIFELNDF